MFAIWKRFSIIQSWICFGKHLTGGVAYALLAQFHQDLFLSGKIERNCITNQTIRLFDDGISALSKPMVLLRFLGCGLYLGI